MIQVSKSFNERLEAELSRLDHQSKYVKRGVEKGFNVLAVLTKHDYLRNNKPKTEKMFADQLDYDTVKAIKEKIYGANLVGDEGDKFYAQRAASETPTNNFAGANGRQELGNGTQGTPGKTSTYVNLIGPVTASRKIIDSTYPKTNDGDSDNTGAGVDIVTWLTSWSKTDFTSTGLSGGVIHNAAGSPVSGSVLLTYWTITAFDKTADDTLKIFINHTFTGV